MYLPLLTYQSGKNKGKFIGKARIREDQKIIVWPNGATMKFAYMATDKDAELNWQGQEVTVCLWDEFGQSSEFQFHYIRSRLRSKSKHKSRMFCTLNPNKDHISYEFVKQYLDADGYPIKELSGKTGYFCIVDNILYTGWEKKELTDRFPQAAVKTYTYIPGTLDDNKVLQDLEPEYRATLASLPPEQQKALLYGCWHYTTTDKTYFDRNWCEYVDKVPNEVRLARGWDKASTAPSINNKHPDYTASTYMAKSRDGYYYIMGAKRFQKSPGERDAEMVAIAQNDGPDVHQIIPKDPGQAGVCEFQESCKKFIEAGVTVKEDKSKGDKVVRFSLFSAACQAGLVKIVRNTFDPEELKEFLSELERFDGSKSTAARKDDWVDSTATAFNYLCKQKVIPTFTLQRPNSPTMMSHVKGL